MTDSLVSLRKITVAAVAIVSVTIVACDTTDINTDIGDTVNIGAQQTRPAATGVGESVIASGPWVFLRSNGKPITETHAYSLPALCSYIGGPYSLVVENSGVSSASIELDGKPVFGPSDFSGGNATLVSPIQPMASGYVAVRLASKPGSSLTVRIEGIEANVEDQLEVHYPFDGDALDVSGNGRHGILDGPTPTTDRCGSSAGAYSFDGVDDQVAMSNIAGVDFNSGGTLTTWVHPSIHHTGGGNIVNISDASNTKDFLVAWSDDRFIARMHSGTPFAEIHTATDYPGDQWYFVALRYEANVLILEVDGVAAGTAAPLQGIVSSFAYVGRNTHAASSFLQGDIDDVRVYSRRLTDSEVAVLGQY